MTTPERVNKLKAAMHGMSGPPEPTVVPAVPENAGVQSPKLAPSRRGKRNVSAYIALAAAKQLRFLALERDTSTQELVAEALNDLFRKYGKSAIA